MPATRILPPFIAVMLLTLVVWIYMYARRIPFIVRAQFTDTQMASQEFARLSPPQVSNPSDNLKNLFELPTLFYALVLYLYARGQVDALYVAAAWVFAVFRILHSVVHCTINIVLLRFWLYAAGALALWFMVIRAAVHLALPS